MSDPSETEALTARLLAIMARLRDPDGGCPWDREQDFHSIAPYTLEEAYEVADAIARGDPGELCGELGDLLFQVVYHARMAEERGWFDYADVVRGVSDKLVRRHPHVFGDERVGDAREQTRAWEAHKARERAAAAAGSRLDGVAAALPALSRAAKLQRRAAHVGFDWPDAEGVRDKLHEELAELARAGADADARREELGDVLFTCVNLARHLDVDAEDALRRANAKFEARFRAMEAAARAAGEDLEALDGAALEALWRRAKTQP